MSTEDKEPASGNGKTASAAELAAQEDAAAVTAFESGSTAEAIRHLGEAERLAHASGDRAQMLRQLVRMQALAPHRDRAQLIAASAPGAAWADLFEVHAGDLLGQSSRPPEPPPLAGELRTASPWQGGLAASVRRWQRPLGVAAAWLVAGAAGLWSLLAFVLSPSSAGAGGTGVQAQARAWLETLSGALLGFAHIGKALFYDPVSRTVSVVRSVLDVGGAATMLREAVADIWSTSTGCAAMLVMLVALAAIPIRVIQLHWGAARCRPGDRLVYAGRRLWYSYHRRLTVPPLAALGGIAMHELGLPLLAIPFDAVATFGLAVVLWTLVPATRPLLVIAESPRDVRLATIELLSGVARPRHINLPAYEIRAANKAPTSAWSLAQDIHLRMANGEVVLLEGFVGPRRARDLIASINRLVHGVPPLQSSAAPATHVHT